MTGKKYKPALFELVAKGSAKLDGKGSIEVPQWFSPGTGGNSEPLRREPLQGSGGVPAGPAQGDAVADADNVAPHSDRHHELGQEVDRASEPRAGRLQLRLSIPYWGLGVAALGLLLAVLVVYRLGQYSVERELTAAELPVNSPLEKVRQSPLRKDVLSLERPSRPTAPIEKTTANEAAKINRPAPASVTVPEAVGLASPKAPTGGLSLVLCGHDKREVLEPVKAYFDAAGLTTGIGRSGDRYVVYSLETVESKTEATAQRLAQQIARLGASYNSSKPTGVPGFTASTFSSAYWVNIADIKAIE